MPAKLDETYAPRPWACGECKCILGVVMRDTSRIRRLYVFFQYRTSETMPTKADLWMQPRRMFKVHGLNSCDGVECGVCGALNEWTPSQESFRVLMSHFTEVKRELV
jgi:hypothetical protein